MVRGPKLAPHRISLAGLGEAECRETAIARNTKTFKAMRMAVGERSQ
jgi:hypothetical protein